LENEWFSEDEGLDLLRFIPEDVSHRIAEFGIIFFLFELGESQGQGQKEGYSAGQENPEEIPGGQKL